MPRATVIIPLYNKAAEVERALNSALEQSERDLRIVVVDDGSTDGSAERVLAFKDPRLRVVRQENRGVSAARNRGITEADTELVAFLDADDEWRPRFLETVLCLAAHYPEADVFATAYEMAEADGTVLKPRLREVPEQPEGGIIPDFFASTFLGDCPLCASNVLVRRSVFEEVGGFPEGEQLSEDWDMWARIALQGRIAYCPVPHVIYHLEASNRAMRRLRHTGTDTCLVRTLREAVRKRRFEFTNEWAVKAFLSEQLYQLARAALVCGNGKRARELVAEARAYGVIRRHWARMVVRSYLGGPINRFLDAVSQIERRLRRRRRRVRTPKELKSRKSP